MPLPDHLGTSEDVANVVSFLVSDQAKYITGEYLLSSSSMSSILCQANQYGSSMLWFSPGSYSCRSLSMVEGFMIDILSCNSNKYAINSHDFTSNHPRP